MNPVCALPEMDEVRNELLIASTRVLCVCGARKMPEAYPFCGDCRDRLNRIDARLWVWTYRHLHSTPNRMAGLWLYDLCVDLLRDPQAGVTRLKKRDEEL